jgi:5-methylcytosine-specific restriction endonuclease McrA
MKDDDVTNQKGIYTYVLTGEERYLNIRAFDQRQKRSAYERQNGVCVKCQERFTIDEMEADHITPWSKGGKTEPENCQILCADCNRRKSNI